MALRTVAAIVLAFTFAIAVAGLYTLFGPQEIDQNFVWGLLAVVPLWVTTGAALYAAESSSKSVAWLVAANVACYAVLSAHALAVG